jgi:uncharacterized protein (DUF433 family)
MIQDSVAPMNLPEFLTSDDGGYISLTGHRIGLHHVVRVYEEGYSPEMIVGHFPTLSLALVHKVIAFYLENQIEVAEYVAAHDREIERQMSPPQTTPTLVQLRARLEAQRKAERAPVSPVEP